MPSPVAGSVSRKLKNDRWHRGGDALRLRKALLVIPVSAVLIVMMSLIIIASLPNSACWAEVAGPITVQ